ncbi:hypothetical protein H7X69_00635 [Candidatus Saccharibacteria bacterium]|nr:hypothetical protein [Candidatus Saccharibacteria bacterium]
MSYTLLIELCVMIMVAKGMEKFHWKIYWAAFFCVITPFGIAALTSLIYTRGAAGQLFMLNNVLTLLCQYIVALVVFKLLDTYDDTIVVWFAWLLGGGVIIFVFIPAIIQKLG